MNNNTQAAANKAEEGEQERFEAWYFPKFGPQPKLGDSDQYQMSFAQGAWQAWQAAIAADRASRQAAANKAEVEPTCVCGSPATLGSVHRTDGPCYVAEATIPANKADVEPELCAEIEKLTHYKHCMSYNDSYFGEPAGLVKQVAYQLDRIISGRAAAADHNYSKKLAKRGAPVAEVRAAERVEAMHKGVVGVLAGVKAEALATPPATTGASTGWQKLNDVQWMNIVNHDRAYESYRKDDAVHEAVKRTEAKLKELNAGPGGASTVLMDERTSIDTPEMDRLLVSYSMAVRAGESAQLQHALLIAHIDQHVAREVAAQAGQVAVPDDVAFDAARWRFMMRVADDADGLEAQAMESLGNEQMETERPESEQMCELVDQAIAKVAAPSPAKESK